MSAETDYGLFFFALPGSDMGEVEEMVCRIFEDCTSSRPPINLLGESCIMEILDDRDPKGFVLHVIPQDSNVQKDVESTKTKIPEDLSLVCPVASLTFSFFEEEADDDEGLGERALVAFLPFTSSS